MTERVRQPWVTFVELVKRACDQLFPGIGRYDRMVYARVTRFSQSGGTVSSGLKLWSVDVDILGPDLEVDPRRPSLQDVPVDPTEINGSGRALFPLPFVGLIVRLGWMYGNRSLPYIHSFTAEGQSVPADQSGELSSTLSEAIRLLSRPRQSAVGPVPMDPTDLIDFTNLLDRIP